MAQRTAGERRSEFIARARIAFREGVSQTRFLQQAVREGYSFRRTDMITEFHAVTGIEKQTGLLRYVRKDYTPSKKVIADVPWNLSSEFMYKVRVQSRVRPDEPITERMVNIMQDRPLTPREIESLAWEMIQSQSPAKVAEVEQVTAWTVIHKVAE